MLRKALESKLPVILVVNKVDRPDARIAEVVDEVYELFLDLDAAEDQIEFPIVYTQRARRLGGARPRAPRAPTSSRCSSSCSSASPRPSSSPATRCRPTSPTSTPRPTSAASRCAACATATIRKGQHRRVVPGRRHVERVKWRALRHRGLDRVAAEEAGPGEIIAVAGLDEVTIGETLADPDDPRPLPVITVDGRGFEVLVNIDLVSKHRDDFLAFEQQVSAFDEVVELRRMFGLPDYFVRVATRDLESYEAFVVDRLARTPDWRGSTRT